MSVVKLDSYKEFSPQSLVDEMQTAIDRGEVKDVVIILREKNGDVRFLTTPLSDAETIGLIEMTKMAVFNY